MKSPRQLGGGFPDAQEAAPGSRCGRGPAPPPLRARTPAPPRWHCHSRHRPRHQRGVRFGEQRLAVSDGAVQIVDSVGASIGAGFSCVWRFFLSPHVTKCHALLPPTLGLIDTLSCLSACLLTTRPLRA